jgi:zinc/manganese transport system substrate-binding protein
MKTNRLLFACLAWLLFAPQVHAKLNVVATTADLAALAAAVGGDRVELTTLARPTEDPHFVEPKPSFIVKLNRADAVIEGGAELESAWLGPLLAGARNPKLAVNAPGRVVCNAGIQMLDVPAQRDRSQGHVHASGNPHYLMDPLNARLAARTIAAAFTKLEPASATVFQANLDTFTAALDARLAEWRKRLEPFAGRRVVAYHDSWAYFARRFGVRVDLFLEPKPGIPPSPAHLAAVAAQMKADNVRVIFQEPHLNRRTADTVARAAGGTVIEVTQFPGGLKGAGPGYLETMEHNLRALVSALEAK